MAQSVDRALALLSAVVSAPEPVTLMELVDITGVDKSTAQRLLTSFMDRGMLVRDPSTRRYDIGPELFGLAAGVSARSSIRNLAAPHLLELRDRSGETSSLHLKVAERRVCVDGVESLQAVRRVIPLGESLPLPVGPSGKVILAHLPAEERLKIIRRMVPEPPDGRALDDMLRNARTDGYLHTESDRTVGVRAISAPVFDARGVTASITVAGPASRWGEDAARAALPALIEATKDLSVKLGGQR